MEGKVDFEKFAGSNCGSESLPFQKLIGSLMYLAVMTRPVIAFAVNYLSQYNNNFTEYNFKYSKRILRYL